MNLEGTLEYTDPQIDGAFEWIYDMVSLCRQGGDLDPCERMLQGLSDPLLCEQTHTELILTMLRLTCTMRDHLPSWRPARDTAARELAKRGEDIQMLLVGIRD